MVRKPSDEDQSFIKNERGFHPGEDDDKHTKSAPTGAADPGRMHEAIVATWRRGRPRCDKWRNQWIGIKHS